LERQVVPATMEAVMRAVCDRMIMRAMRGHFRGVYLLDRDPLGADEAAIVFANHHNWWDGYFVHLMAKRWRPGNSMVWMRELGSNRPLALLGAMPLPAEDAATRRKTIRRTVQALKRSPAALFLFPEADMHPPPKVHAFERGLHWLHQRLEHAVLKPLAIHIEYGDHQYPQAFLLGGERFICDSEGQTEWLAQAQEAVAKLLDDLRDPAKLAEGSFECLLAGRLSTEERRCSGGRRDHPRPVVGHRGRFRAPAGAQHGKDRTPGETLPER